MHIGGFMNNKGFTVIELVLSFAFVSALTVSLFALVLDYKEKELYAADVAELTTYKNMMTTMIQKDIESKLLKKVDYCRNGEKIVNKCVELFFQDGTSKQLQIAFEKVDTTVSTSTFSYYKYYLIYDDVAYEVPAAGNVELVSNFMLEASTPNDGLENNLSLYSIKVEFRHKTINADAKLIIVALGTEYTSNIVNVYESFNIGDRVAGLLNSGQDSSGYNVGRKEDFFHVIKTSEANDSKVTLLYDNIYTPSVKFNDSVGAGNKIYSSNITAIFDQIYSEWTSVASKDKIRLISANEVTTITNKPPTTILYNAANPIDLTETSTTSFLYRTGGYWTSSNYITYGTEDSVWVVEDKKLQKKLVTSSYGVRPVIELDKKFILARIDESYS